MDTNQRNGANQLDLTKIWLQIATDIQIRKFENLDDVPEFRDLPKSLQNQLKESNINNDYKIFQNEIEFPNYHVILFSKEKAKYLAIYVEKSSTQSSFASLGLMVVFFFIWEELFKTFNRTQTEQLLSVNNGSIGTATASNWSYLLSLVLSIIPSVWAHPYIQRWFSTQNSAYNKLIEGCMLKKLDGIVNSQ